MSIAKPETKCDLRPEVVENVKNLHQANIDSADGFESTANELKDQDLAMAFRRWASERRQQAAELANLVECNADEVDREGSWLAGLHRAYISLRTAVTNDDRQAILEEAERGEDHIKDAYEEVLKGEPGTAISDVLHRQYARVKETHDRVRDLRDACKSC